MMPQGNCLEYNYDYENGFSIGRTKDSHLPVKWRYHELTLSFLIFTSTRGLEQQLGHSGYPGLRLFWVRLCNRHTSTRQTAARHRHATSPAVKEAAKNQATYQRPENPDPFQHLRWGMMTIESVESTVFNHFELLFYPPASIPLPVSRNDSIEVANQRRLLRTLEQLTNRLKRTLARQPLSSFHVSSEMIVADPKSLEGRKAFLSCRPGSVLKGRMCGESEEMTT